MIDPNHHPSCATQIDNLRCTCERERAWDAERRERLRAQDAERKGNAEGRNLVARELNR